MNKRTLESFFLNEEVSPKTNLNADMVEATINQLIAELKEQEIRNEELILAHKSASNSLEQIKVECVNKGLRIALTHLRKLNADIVWKQLSLNLKTQDND